MVTAGRQHAGHSLTMDRVLQAPNTHQAMIPAHAFSIAPASCVVCLQPVGIANTVTKYQEHKPVKPHLTPFEARVEAKMVEEEVISAAVQATGSNGGSSMAADSGVKQLVFDEAAMLTGSSEVQATA